MKVIVFVLSVLVVFGQAAPPYERTVETDITVDYNRDYQRDYSYDVTYADSPDYVFDEPESQLVEFNEYEIEYAEPVEYEIVKETDIDIEYQWDVQRDKNVQTILSR